MTCLAINQGHSLSSETRYSGSEGRRIASLFSEAWGKVKAEPSQRADVFYELNELKADATEVLTEEDCSTLDDATYEIAKRFLLALPGDLPKPELSLDDDGDIGLDWFGPLGANMTLSLRGNGRVIYAGTMSPVKRYSGIDEFIDEIPAEIIQKIRHFKE